MCVTERPPCMLFYLHGIVNNLLIANSDRTTSYFSERINEMNNTLCAATYAYVQVLVDHYMYRLVDLFFGERLVDH
jgi:hypothetical protein